MRNGFGEVENCLATLLVHVKIESKATGQEKYHSKNDLQFVKKNYQDLLKIKEDKIKSKIRGVSGFRKLAGQEFKFSVVFLIKAM